MSIPYAYIMIGLAAIMIIAAINSLTLSKPVRIIFLLLSNALVLLSVYYYPSQLHPSSVSILYIVFGLCSILAIHRIFRGFSQPIEKYEAWHKDPKNWKWKVFYFNPEDERLFPPKRLTGLGWTVNFGNPYSIMAFAALFLAVLVVMTQIS